jgi:hypothetical protein
MVAPAAGGYRDTLSGWYVQRPRISIPKFPNVACRSRYARAAGPWRAYSGGPVIAAVRRIGKNY